MTPIERAARAAAEQYGEEWDRLPVVNYIPNGDLDQQHFLDQARAVLQALREPSEAMIEAASEMDAPYSWTEEGARERDILKWAVMIDKALEEG